MFDVHLCLAESVKTMILAEGSRRSRSLEPSFERIREPRLDSGKHAHLCPPCGERAVRLDHRLQDPEVVPAGVVAGRHARDGDERDRDVRHAPGAGSDVERDRIGAVLRARAGVRARFHGQRRPAHELGGDVGRRRQPHPARGACAGARARAAPPAKPGTVLRPRGEQDARVRRERRLTDAWARDPFRLADHRARPLDADGQRGPLRGSAAERARRRDGGTYSHAKAQPQPVPHSPRHDPHLRGSCLPPQAPWRIAAVVSMGRSAYSTFRAAG